MGWPLGNYKYLHLGTILTTIADCNLPRLRCSLGLDAVSLLKVSQFQRWWDLWLLQRLLSRYQHHRPVRVRSVRGVCLLMGIFPGCATLHKVLCLVDWHTELCLRRWNRNILPLSASVGRRHRLCTLRCLRNHLLHQLDPTYPLCCGYVAADNGYRKVAPCSRLHHKHDWWHRCLGLWRLVFGYTRRHLYSLHAKQLGLNIEPFMS